MGLQSALEGGGNNSFSGGNNSSSTGVNASGFTSASGSGFMPSSISGSSGFAPRKASVSFNAMMPPDVLTHMMVRHPLNTPY